MTLKYYSFYKCKNELKYQLPQKGDLLYSCIISTTNTHTNNENWKQYVYKLFDISGLEDLDFFWESEPIHAQQ